MVAGSNLRAGTHYGRAGGALRNGRLGGEDRRVPENQKGGDRRPGGARRPSHRNGAARDRRPAAHNGSSRAVGVETPEKGLAGQSLVDPLTTAHHGALVRSARGYNRCKGLAPLSINVPRSPQNHPRRSRTTAHRGGAPLPHS